MSVVSRAFSATALIHPHSVIAVTALSFATIVVAGCSYRAGSFADTAGVFPGPRVAMPCLDLAVALVHSPSATGPVIEYSFGNRCRNMVTVDLEAARVTARDAAGNQIALHPYDPRREIRPLPLDGLMSGREQIFYLGRAPMSAIAICVDVGSIDRSAPATTTPVCLAEAGTEMRL